MNVCDTMKQLNSERTDAFMHELYGNGAAENKARYEAVLKGFKEAFGDSEEVLLFSSPGRTEISGNHTDHNHGKVLAGSINLDCVGAAAKNYSNQVHIISETYDQNITIDLNDLEPSIKKAGTVDLIKGLLKGFETSGYSVGGFNAYITSNVISAAGVSSSASFEMLVCSMLNTFFNESHMDNVAYAHIGKYAENVYFGKMSGLMDQTASSVGGVVAIDFRDNANPVVRKLDFDFTKAGYALCIIDSGADHADLSDEYSAIPMEMRQVAAHFGKEVLREVALADFLTDMAAVREKAGDRATLRAYHFLKDNQRAIDEAAALEAGDFDKFLSLVKESGYSSFMYLQNVYVSGSVEHQEVAYTLAACEAALAGKGAYRVHGGGFAGTIQAFVPQEMLAGFVEQMEKAVGKGGCHVLSIRPAGGTELMKV